ncbi:hypothetical protein QE152_g1791 [Popillia japonica]|uniref:Uncharacterized protein n=1 Tax=Popillia japonica TaxID=7064 RepID=A0AAW1N580_POPJA
MPLLLKQTSIAATLPSTANVKKKKMSLGLDLTRVPVQNVEILELDTPITTDTSTHMDGGSTDVGPVDKDGHGLTGVMRDRIASAREKEVMINSID